MADVLDIHDQVLDLLLSRRINNSDLRFALRRSNRDNKLEDGYWFYGNDDYVAISFWSGNDWKNRTPTINFIIIPETEKTFLQISVSDSNLKKSFCRKFSDGAIET